MLGVISDLYSTLLPSPATFRSFERRGHQLRLQHQSLRPGPPRLNGISYQVVTAGVSPRLRIPGTFQLAEVTPEAHRGPEFYYKEVVTTLATARSTRPPLGSVSGRVDYPKVEELTTMK